MDPREILRQSYLAALEGASPDRLLRPHLPHLPPMDLLVCIGKAALPLYQAARAKFEDVPAVVVAPKGSPVPAVPAHVQVFLAGHPLPDETGVEAAHVVLQQLSRLGPAQQVLLLVSGGGSALFCAPWGVGLPDKQQVAAQLMRAGASIQELNTVRKHLSQVKGGRLAASTRAHMHAFLLSDVVGDDPAVIASGLTAPDPSTYQDALQVLERHRIEVPAVTQHLQEGALGKWPETPKTLSKVSNTVLGSNLHLLQAARDFLHRQGCEVDILSDQYTGEARDLAALHVQHIEARRKHPTQAPRVLLSGGEATVTVRGQGRGGRNQELALWLLACLQDRGVHALVAGSDGIDGNSEAAGAFLTPDSWQRAQRMGLHPAAFLENNDSARFFQLLQDQWVTGPTGHNLNDFRAIWI